MKTLSRIRRLLISSFSKKKRKSDCNECSYVSAYNHGFDPLVYLDNVPAKRVQQFHIAGYLNLNNIIIDSHGDSVIDPVWALYEAALRRYGPVSTMIERDDNIPPFGELLAELEMARRIAGSLELAA